VRFGGVTGASCASVCLETHVEARLKVSRTVHTPRAMHCWLNVISTIDTQAAPRHGWRLPNCAFQHARVEAVRKVHTVRLSIQGWRLAHWAFEHARVQAVRKVTLCI
jgi:hypothetical protein